MYVLWWLRAPSIQHFSGFPPVAPEPSELTLTINNHVCSTAYILAAVHQHSRDVWAVPCVAPAESARRFAAGEPERLRCMRPNREPTAEGAAVSTTSGNSFSDHILPAKPLHGSLPPPLLSNSLQLAALLTQGMRRIPLASFGLFMCTLCCGQA